MPKKTKQAAAHAAAVAPDNVTSPKNKISDILSCKARSYPFFQQSAVFQQTLRCAAIAPVLTDSC